MVPSFSEETLSKDFDLILFDIDDTIAPLLTGLEEANRAWMSYMISHMPRTAAVISLDSMSKDMKRYKQIV